MNIAIQPKGHAIKKVYIGIDAHKAESEAINNFQRKQCRRHGSSNVVALAFAGKEPSELYGKASADLKAFEAVLRRIMKK